MDHFAVFGEQPRPWLDPAALHQTFLRLSAEVHPDKFQDPAEKDEAEKRFAALNRSYETLRHTRSRLVHLLEQLGERNPAQVQNVPPKAAEFFVPIAEISRRTDELLKQRAEATSPMLKVQWFEKALEATSEVQELQSRVARCIEEIDSEVRRLDDLWMSGRDPALVGPLQQAAATLGFLERWNNQLQQKLAALAF